MTTPIESINASLSESERLCAGATEGPRRDCGACGGTGIGGISDCPKCGGSGTVCGYEQRFRDFAEQACREEKVAAYDDKREAELVKLGEASAYSRMIPDGMRADAELAASRTRWPNETAALRCAVEALKFYADKENYIADAQGEPSRVDYERGDRARAALHDAAAILEKGKPHA